MKTTWIYSLALALAVTMATTGCRHTPGKTTPLYKPGTATQMVEPGPGPSLTYTPPGNGGDNPIPLQSQDLMYGMKPDREALAAYTIHFAYDSAAIRKSEQTSLQSVASALGADSTTKLLVEGNCDERGTEEYNRSLGERRALAAREALAKDGVDPTRVFTRSYGKDKPTDTGHDESAWSKNRRDDFVLLRP
jgi:peptidoglycan-associated lipoprotein